MHQDSTVTGAPLRPLEGRTAVVAGASRGIGMGAAIELGAAGAHVYALGRTLEPDPGGPAGSLAETVRAIQALGGDATPVRCDCTRPDEVLAVLERIRSERGSLHVLVNSVFAAHEFGSSIGKRFWELPVSIWESTVTLGAGSAYLASALAAPLLIETAAREGAPTLIVNVSGRGGAAHRYNVGYGVGKAALERLTADCALELSDRSVAVVTLWPNGYRIDGEPQETPRYSGRAVSALAADTAIMVRSGRRYWSAELGAELGFTDEHGRAHSVAPLVDHLSLQSGGRASS